MEIRQCFEIVKDTFKEVQKKLIHIHNGLTKLFRRSYVHIEIQMPSRIEKSGVAEMDCASTMGVGSFVHTSGSILINARKEKMVMMAILLLLVGWLVGWLVCLVVTSWGEE